ncbi:hypothetical protein NIES2111_62010 (plasmid) [Nostoc sp. NIES-2111]|nr:hypothetical protein NIES2111_62010 [Nostoc sp. NIES-2111]
MYWTCGIIHVFSMINFFYDSSQALRIKASELYQVFGIAESMGQVARDFQKNLFKNL